MSHRYQHEQPPVRAEETGRDLIPRYPSESYDSYRTYPINPAEWRHICACRFGEGRPCSVNHPDRTQWTGDSYRYDIFFNDAEQTYALRWWNGAGEGWLIDQNKGRRGQESILHYLAAIPVEEQRWDAVHGLWSAVTITAANAAAKESDRLLTAFLSGRLKKRRQRGRVFADVVSA